MFVGIVMGFVRAQAFYHAYRGIKRGFVQFKGPAFKRSSDPFCFWFTIAVLEIIGSMLIRGALKLLVPA